MLGDQNSATTVLVQCICVHWTTQMTQSVQLISLRGSSSMTYRELMSEIHVAEQHA